jgi:hypothetical protein
MDTGLQGSASAGFLLMRWLGLFLAGVARHATLFLLLSQKK